MSKGNHSDYAKVSDLQKVSEEEDWDFPTFEPMKKLKGRFVPRVDIPAGLLQPTKIYNVPQVDHGTTTYECTKCHISKPIEEMKIQSLTASSPDCLSCCKEIDAKSLKGGVFDLSNIKKCSDCDNTFLPTMYQDQTKCWNCSNPSPKTSWYMPIVCSLTSIAVFTSLAVSLGTNYLLNNNTFIDQYLCN